MTTATDRTSRSESDRVLQAAVDLVAERGGVAPQIGVADIAARAEVDPDRAATLLRTMSGALALKGLKYHQGGGMGAEGSFVHLLD